MPKRKLCLCLSSPRTYGTPSPPRMFGHQLPISDARNLGRLNDLFTVLQRLLVTDPRQQEVADCVTEAVPAMPTSVGWLIADFADNIRYTVRECIRIMTSYEANDLRCIASRVSQNLKVQTGYHLRTTATATLRTDEDADVFHTTAAAVRRRLYNFEMLIGEEDANGDYAYSTKVPRADRFTGKVGTPGDNPMNPIIINDDEEDLLDALLPSNRHYNPVTPSTEIYTDDEATDVEATANDTDDEDAEIEELDEVDVPNWPPTVFAPLVDTP